MNTKNKGWLLAFDPQDSFTRQDIVERCDQIQAICPDLRAWDPAGRGPSAPPAQWLLDLVLCAGVAQIQEVHGYPDRVPRRASDFYVQMALELSGRVAPGAILLIDGKTPSPPRLAMARRATPETLGANQFAVFKGDMFEALFDPWLMSVGKPHSKADLLQLTLNMLQGVELALDEGVGALNRLLSNNRCFQGPGDCYDTKEATRIASALASATSGFNLDALELSAWSIKSLRELHPQLLRCLRRHGAASTEKKILSEAVREPLKKSAPRRM